MSNAVVRVDQRVHSKLREVSENERRPIGQIVAELVDRYERETLWKQMQSGLAELRADPDAWKAYQDEIALWDSTVGDGLENEESYYTEEEEEQINAEYAESQNR